MRQLAFEPLGDVRQLAARLGELGIGIAAAEHPLPFPPHLTVGHVRQPPGALLGTGLRRERSGPGRAQCGKRRAEVLVDDLVSTRICACW